MARWPKNDTKEINDVHIHPYGWLITVPIAIAMIQVAFAPRENPIKRLWWSMRELESEAWFRLGRGYEEPQFSPTFKRCYAATIAVLALLSIASFCAFIELIPGG